MEDSTHQIRINLEARLQAGSEAGRFEIIAITAGEGNGWKFNESCLQESLALWEGVETFIDHGSLWMGRSVRDLAGVCSSPAWDQDRQGIKLKLKASGPSGPLLDSIAREWLAETGSRPRLGFSADVLFTAKGREVK
ncbi:MAG TPA: hypothetical protein VF889_01010, partial [Bacteroidota bacterium]